MEQVSENRSRTLVTVFVNSDPETDSEPAVIEPVTAVAADPVTVPTASHH